MPSLSRVLDRPLDLYLTLGIHVHGPADPTTRREAGWLVRTSWTPDGPSTVALQVCDGRLRAEAWGPGADRALAGVPALVGLGDEPAPLGRGHRLVTELARRMPGLRIGRSGSVFEAANFRRRETVCRSAGRLPRIGCVSDGPGVGGGRGRTPG